MGALVSKALRPLKSFNIENRAHRVISKEKPTVAPYYPSTLEELKRVKELDPNIDEKLSKKDPELDERLKDVYVTSYGRPESDVTKERQERSINRPLPQDRNALPDFDYGLKEPDKIPYGRTSLRNAIDFISAYQMNPEEITVGKIAFEYKLKEEDVENILKYFKTYEVYLPATKTTPARFAGPTELRKQLYKDKAKEIVPAPRNGSIGAASLGARRDAPAERRAPSVRSDERPLATQGDMLNSIKFQRRFRDTITAERQGSKCNEKTSTTSKDKSCIRNINSKTSSISGPKPLIGHENREKSGTSTSKRFFNSPRPSSPKGRRSPHPAFY